MQSTSIYTHKTPPINLGGILTSILDLCELLSLSAPTRGTKQLSGPTREEYSKIGNRKVTVSKLANGWINGKRHYECTEMVGKCSREVDFELPVSSYMDRKSRGNVL